MITTKLAPEIEQTNPVKVYRKKTGKHDDEVYSTTTKEYRMSKKPHSTRLYKHEYITQGYINTRLYKHEKDYIS